MVNDIQARLIAKEVVKKYGIGMQTKVISREEALPIVGFKKGGNVADVPPSFFDFNTLYIIDPQTNWPQEGQLDADNGKPGISERFCFYLVVHEFGQKICTSKRNDCYSRKSTLGKNAKRLGET